MTATTSISPAARCSVPISGVTVTVNCGLQLEVAARQHLTRGLRRRHRRPALERREGESIAEARVRRQADVRARARHPPAKTTGPSSHEERDGVDER